MKTGDKVVRQNKAHKHAMGSSANGVANKFLADLRGEWVAVGWAGNENSRINGKLLGFDLYSLLIESDHGPVLVFKGPGIAVKPL